jgi:hypothetical protein
LETEKGVLRPLKGRISYEEYTAIDAVNWSALRHMMRSPAHYAAERARKPPTDNDHFRLGRAVHAAVFEPDVFRTQFAVWNGAVRRGKEWDAFVAANADKTVLTLEQAMQASALAQAVRSNRCAARYLAEGEAEQTLTWTYSATEAREAVVDDVPRVEFVLGRETRCKGRLDWIAPAGIVDLKTTRDAEPEAFSTSAWRLAYYGQAAWYVDGYERVTGRRLPFIIIAVEKAYPYVVQVYRVPDDYLEQGRELYRALLDRLRVCQRDGLWPGYCDDEMQLLPPRWARPSEDEDIGDLDLDFGSAEED